jgi:hypothetical protein
LKSKSKIYNCVAKRVATAASLADYVKGITKATQHKIKIVYRFHSFFSYVDAAA